MSTKKWLISLGCSLTLFAAGFVVLAGSAALWWFVLRVPRSELESILQTVEKKKLPAGSYTSGAFSAAEQKRFNLRAAPDYVSSNLNFVVEANGNVVLLWKTSMGWKANYSGYVYSRMPLPAILPTDYYGRTIVGVAGLDNEEAVVDRKIDNRCLKVYFDLY